AVAGEDRVYTFRRRSAFGGIVDCRERLQRNRFEGVLGERAAEVVPVATHGECGYPDRAAEIEGKDLRLRIASKLQRHERQQHALAGAGRSDHERVPAMADIQGEPERGRAFGLGKEQWRSTPLGVSLPSPPT